MNAADLIAEFEGFREKPYHCTEGFPTVGYGKKLGPKNAPLDFYSLIVPEPVARFWLAHDIQQLQPDVSALCPGIDGVRLAALVSMAYQLGLRGLKNFKKTLAALNAGEWNEASKEALDSRWARQTPYRAEVTAKMLLTGRWPE